MAEVVNADSFARLRTTRERFPALLRDDTLALGRAAIPQLKPLSGSAL
jgi:hypothetical protein